MIRMITVATVLAASTLGLVTTPALAASPPTAMGIGSTIAVSATSGSADATYRNVSTGFCLDSNANRNVYTHRCNGGNYQRWTVIRRGGGAVSLKNVSTGFCLDSNANRNVYTHRCNGGNYQNWSVIRHPNGVTFKNVSTGFCLDSNANRNVYTHRCNGGNYQRWS